MPPATALRRLEVAPEQWVGHPDLAMLTRYTADLLRGAGGKPPHLDDLITQGYDSLRECLPASKPSDMMSDAMPDGMPGTRHITSPQP
jgi:hypothetical protein